jgi:hypothetical protein
VDEQTGFATQTQRSGETEPVGGEVDCGAFDICSVASDVIQRPCARTLPYRVWAVDRSRGSRRYWSRTTMQFLALSTTSWPEGPAATSGAKT